MLSASFEHIAANAAAFSAAIASAYRASEGSAGRLGDGVARNGNAVERSFSKIENDLGGHTSSYCWSEACFAALENCFGTKTVRILAGTNRSGGVSRFDTICNVWGQYSAGVILAVA